MVLLVGEYEKERKIKIMAKQNSKRMSRFWLHKYQERIERKIGNNGKAGRRKRRKRC